MVGFYYLARVESNFPHETSILQFRVENCGESSFKVNRQRARIIGHIRGDSMARNMRIENFWFLALFSRGRNGV